MLRQSWPGSGWDIHWIPEGWQSASWPPQIFSQQCCVLGSASDYRAPYNSVACPRAQDYNMLGSHDQDIPQPLTFPLPKVIPNPTEWHQKCITNRIACIG